jgi:hypothetical protein
VPIREISKPTIREICRTDDSPLDTRELALCVIKDKDMDEKGHDIACIHSFSDCASTRVPGEKGVLFCHGK